MYSSPKRGKGSIMKSFLFRCTAFGVAVFIALGIGELALRIMNVSFPAFNVPDPITGYALRPHTEGWYHGEGDTYLKINSAGFNDRERTQNKAAGTFRVAVIGDSFTEAFDVEREKNFVSLLEKKMPLCMPAGKRNIEVLNFGVGGYGTAQELLTLRHKVWQYDPDLVVLAFFAGNDVRNNYRGLQKEKLYAYFVSENGRLVEDKSFLATPEYARRQSPQWKWMQTASDYSRVLQVVNESKKKFQTLLKRKTAPTHTKAGEEWGLDYEVFTEPNSQDWNSAWEITEQLLVAVKREVEQRRKPFLLLSIASGIQVHPDEEVANAAKSALGVKNLDYVEKRLKALAQRENIDFLSLAEPMAQHAKREGIFFHGGRHTEKGLGHWNEAGHAFAADLLHQKLCNLTLSEKRTL